MMQCVDLRSVQSNKITGLDERLCTHTNGGRQGLVTRLAIIYVRRVEPRCKVFHYLSIKLQLEQSSSPNYPTEKH